MSSEYLTHHGPEKSWLSTDGALKQMYYVLEMVAPTGTGREFVPLTFLPFRS